MYRSRCVVLLLQCCSSVDFRFSCLVSSVNALSDNMQYTGPATVEDANLCECNTVAYALFSACAACQGKNYARFVSSLWLQRPSSFRSVAGVLGMHIVPRHSSRRKFSEYDIYAILPPASSLPFGIPENTSIPQWAYLNYAVRHKYASMV